MLTYELPSRIGLSAEEVVDRLHGHTVVTPEDLAAVVEENNHRIHQQLSSVIGQINDNLNQLEHR